jgi:hypothetical protein
MKGEVITRNKGENPISGMVKDISPKRKALIYKIPPIVDRAASANKDHQKSRPMLEIGSGDNNNQGR